MAGSNSRHDYAHWSTDGLGGQRNDRAPSDAVETELRREIEGIFQGGWEPVHGRNRITRRATGGLGMFLLTVLSSSRISIW